MTGTSTWVFSWSASEATLGIGSHVSVDVRLGLVLLGFVAIDLLFRWIAFGQVESVAIDVAVFSFVYSGIELLSKADCGSKPTGDCPGLGSVFDIAVRVVAGLVVFLLLAVLHRAAASQQTDVLDDFRERVEELEGTDHFRHLFEVGDKALLVALSPRKEGKQRRRERFLRALLDVLTQDDAKAFVRRPEAETELLMTQEKRYQFLGAFAALGLASLFIPIVALH